MSALPAEPARPTARVARKRSRRIDEILRVAAGLIAERGYYATNLEDIAERLDLTKATLYYYFPSKEALVSACIETLGTEATQRLEATQADLADPARTPASRLRELIISHVVLLLHDYPETGRMFSQFIDWPEPHRTRIKQLRRRHDQMFRAVIEQGVATGDLHPIDPDIALHCLYGALNQTLAWYRGRGRSQLAETAARIADTTLLMFGVPAPDES